MAFTDFPNGLTDATQYLSSQNSLNAQLSGSAADIGRFVVSAELDSSLKEIICSLLAGRGLKLPNIQICISLNLKQLLGAGISSMQQTLYDALSSLDSAMDSFLDHTKLDSVLGRVNNVLAEVTNIANMINFCSSPVDPVQIPNVLENAMETFLGAGKSLIDRIGTIVPDEIGGCLIDGAFNTGVWQSGIMKSIADNYNNVINGTASESFVNSIIVEAESIANDLNDLIDRENNVQTSYNNGGSDLAEQPRSTNTGIGVLFNANDEGISGAVAGGSSLWASYQQLGSYQVEDNDGNVYNNIFELFVDDDLMRILRRTPDPTPEVSERQPVYNYCGEVIGFTKVVSQEDQNTSVGSVPENIDQPGYNAGGLPTNPTTTAQAEAEAAETGQPVTVEITNVDSSTTNQTSTTTSSSNNEGKYIKTFKADENNWTEVEFASERLKPDQYTTWFFEFTAVARDDDSNDNSIAFKIEGLVQREDEDPGLNLYLEPTKVYNQNTQNDEYDVSITIDNNRLLFRVRGEDDETVWTTRFTYLSVIGYE